MGTLTIATTAPQDALLVAAFGARLGLAGNASAAQVKAEVIRMIREVVENHEAAAAARAFVPTSARTLG